MDYGSEKQRENENIFSHTAPCISSLTSPNSSIP